MKMSDGEYTRVLVATDFNETSGRDFFAGILRYVRTVSNWKLTLLQKPEEFTPPRLRIESANGIDGIITSTAEGVAIRKALDSSRLPLVIAGTRTLNFKSRTAPVSQVFLNEKFIGRNAANNILSLGKFASYGFVHSSEPLFQLLSQLRFQGYKSGLNAHGYECESFRLTTDPEPLIRWLTELKKPTVILCSQDLTAYSVLKSCRLADLNVPHAVSVLGIDNDESFCERCRPRLSSILIDSENEGYVAADELNRLLSCSRRSEGRKISCITGTEIIDRGSIRPVTPATDLIRRALSYIENRRGQKTSVNDVVQYLGISRRLADLRFHQFAEASIHEIIQRTRLEEAARRLAVSTASVAKTVQAIGFSNVASFTQLFKRRYQMTPAAYRRSFSKQKSNDKQRK